MRPVGLLLLVLGSFSGFLNPNPLSPPHRIHASPLLVFLLFLAACYWLFQLLRSLRNLFSYWDIQVFYREALHITPVSCAVVVCCEWVGREQKECIFGALGAGGRHCQLAEWGLWPGELPLFR